MSAPNAFGSNLNKAQIVFPIAADGSPMASGASTTAPGAPSTTGAETVQGVGYVSSATDTRPNNATPYTALDVVGNDTPTVLTFANIGPAGGGKVIITRVSLQVNAAAIPAGMGNFRLNLYDAAPTAIADNAPYDLPAGDRAKHVALIEIPTPYDLGATLKADTEGQFYPIRAEVNVPVGGTLYGILQTLNGYAPTAQTVKVTSIYSVLV